ncbi:MAG: hypothetical protein JWO45_85 [Spartobacteria bacterium]|nr:hypothetical protein [Spartobacteria bacterium]
MSDTLNTSVSPKPIAGQDEKRRIPYFRLHAYFARFAADKLLSKSLALQVHWHILHYYGTQQGLSVRKIKGHVIIEHTAKSKQAVADLKRLASAKGEYAWSKAWWEKSPAAGRAIVEASNGRTPAYRSDPDFLLVPKRAEIDPLIERSIKIAQRATTAKPERDRVVVAILRAYRYLKGKQPTPAPAKKFISDVEAFYGEILPGGFEGWRSPNAFKELIDASLMDANPGLAK